MQAADYGKTISSGEERTGMLHSFHDVPVLLLQDVLFHLDSLERSAVRRVCMLWNSVLTASVAYRDMVCYVPVEADATLQRQSSKNRSKRKLRDGNAEHAITLIKGRSLDQYSRALSTVAQHGKPHVRSLFFYGNFLPGTETTGELWSNQKCSFDGCKMRARLLKEFEYATEEQCPLREISFVNCSIFVGELAGRWKVFERIKPRIVLQNVALREVVRFFAFFESFEEFSEIPIVFSGTEILNVAAFLQNKHRLEEYFRRTIDPDYFDPEVHTDILAAVLCNDKNVCMLLMPLLEKYGPKLTPDETSIWKETLTNRRAPRRLTSAFRNYLKLFDPVKYKEQEGLEIEQVDFSEVKPLVWLMMEALIHSQPHHK